MEKEDFIHVKLENREAIQFKKQLLLLEMGILRLTKQIKNYRSLRELELKNKIKINKEIKSINKDIGKIDKINPDLEGYKVKSKKHKEIEPFEKEKKVNVYKDNIEKELQEIQERLRVLDEKF